MSFRDHFSKRADDYARFRPKYSSELFGFLAGLTEDHGHALDCATGSGQAAVSLATHYDHVLGTDASPEQISSAQQHERVTYVNAYAEAVPARDDTFDIVTVAAGLHWFDFDRFYKEIRRVTLTGAVFAAWSYYMFESEPAIVGVMFRYGEELVGAYWPERMHYNRNRYSDIPFPFPRIDAPQFYAEALWSIEEVLGFAATWSASQQYHKIVGEDPIGKVGDELLKAWGDPDRRVQLRWPLHLIVGRVE